MACTLHIIVKLMMTWNFIIMKKFKNPSWVHSQLGYKKGVFNFLRTAKDNFGFLLSCIM